MEQGIKWKGSPSQLLNLGIFSSAIFVVTLPLIFIRWKSLKSTFYEITGKNVCVSINFLEKRKSCIDVDNIQSVSIEKPWFLKVFHLSNIVIRSLNGQELVLAGVRDAERIISKISR